MNKRATRFHDHHRRMLRLLREYVSRWSWQGLGPGLVYRRKPLGRWVAARRREHRGGLLAPWLARELEAVPGWSPTPRDSRQRRTLELLRRHVAARGWRGVSTSSVIIEGVNLTSFVRSRRARRRRGEYIPAWVVKELEAIPGWTWEPIAEKKRATLQLLRKVVDRHRRRAPSVPDEIVALAAWVRSTRKRRNTMRAAARRAVESVPGWTW